MAVSASTRPDPLQQKLLDGMLHTVFGLSAKDLLYEQPALRCVLKLSVVDV